MTHMFGMTGLLSSKYLFRIDFQRLPHIIPENFNIYIFRLFKFQMF
jgi:hypothetical protein